MFIAWNILLTLKLKSDYIEALFYNIKINRYGVYVVKKETSQEDFVQV